MAIETTVVGVDEVQTYLSGMPKRMYDEAKLAIGTSSVSLQETMSHRVTSGPIKKRSGAFARSFKSRVSGTDLKTLKGSVYTGSPYAPIHEYGGTIKAKNAYKGVPGGPFLNIPTEFNQTATGRLRRTAREVFTDGGFISGRAVMGFTSGSSGELLPMFVLVKQVEIIPRLGMQKEAEKEVPTLLSNLAKATGRAIQ